jgi:hypothetical protein
VYGRKKERKREEREREREEKAVVSRKKPTLFHK